MHIDITISRPRTYILIHYIIYSYDIYYTSAKCVVKFITKLFCNKNGNLPINPGQFLKLPICYKSCI